MLTHQEAFWLQLSTVLVAFIGPVVAVILTINYQNRNVMRTAKQNVFMDLISFRNHIPLPWQYLVALNRIDIVFHKEKDICHLWHQYYELHELENSDTVYARREEKKIELLSKIATHLGYIGVDQIFLQRYYQTQGSLDEYIGDGQLKKMAAKYFEGGHKVYEMMMANAANAMESDNQDQKFGQ